MYFSKLIFKARTDVEATEFITVNPSYIASEIYDLENDEVITTPVSCRIERKQ